MISTYPQPQAGLAAALEHEQAARRHTPPDPDDGRGHTKIRRKMARGTRALLFSLKVYPEELGDLDNVQLVRAGQPSGRPCIAALRRDRRRRGERQGADVSEELHALAMMRAGSPVATTTPDPLEDEVQVYSWRKNASGRYSARLWRSRGHRLAGITLF
jgi:hypothetical protein